MMSTSKGEITPPCYYKLVTKLWMQVKFDETGGKEISRKDFLAYTRKDFLAYAFPQHLIQFGGIEKICYHVFFPHTENFSIYLNLV